MSRRRVNKTRKMSKTLRKSKTRRTRRTRRMRRTLRKGGKRMSKTRRTLRGGANLYETPMFPYQQGEFVPHTDGSGPTPAKTVTPPAALGAGTGSGRDPGSRNVRPFAAAGEDGETQYEVPRHEGTQLLYEVPTMEYNAKIPSPERIESETTKPLHTIVTREVQAADKLATASCHKFRLTVKFSQILEEYKNQINNSAFIDEYVKQVRPLMNSWIAQIDQVGQYETKLNSVWSKLTTALNDPNNLVIKAMKCGIFVVDTSADDSPEYKVIYYDKTRKDWAVILETPLEKFDYDIKDADQDDPIFYKLTKRKLTGEWEIRKTTNPKYVATIMVLTGKDVVKKFNVIHNDRGKFELSPNNNSGASIEAENGKALIELYKNPDRYPHLIERLKWD